MMHERTPCGLLAAALLLAMAAPASAETSGVSASGLLVTHRAEVQATPQQLFAAIGHPERWWNGEHTYSGKASNLSLDLQAGACFCERWDGGSVEHGRVINVGRDSVVRLQGAFGPLQALAVDGVLTLGIAVREGKTVLLATYRVSGNAEAGLDKLAGPVDTVIGDQVRRLAAYAEGREP